MKNFADKRWLTMKCDICKLPIGSTYDHSKCSKERQKETQKVPRKSVKQKRITSKYINYLCSL